MTATGIRVQFQIEIAVIQQMLVHSEILHPNLRHPLLL